MIRLMQINDFFLQKRIGVIGVSRNPREFSYKIYNELKNRNYEVTPINPCVDVIGMEKCYWNIYFTPDDINTILFLTPKSETEKTITSAINKEIKHIWIQPFSDTPNAIKIGNNADINFIFGYCILMFLEPVKGIHGIHRFFSELFNKYPGI